VGAVLYFSSSKKSPDATPQIKTDQLANSTAPMSDQPTTTDTSTPAQQEPATTTQYAKVAPTPKPTQAELDKIDISTWKTYTNKDYGYEIKYPSDWSIITREDSQVNFLAPETPKFDPHEPGEGNIGITMQNIEGSQIPDLPSQYSSEKIIKMDGNNANLYEGVPGGQDASTPSFVFVSTYLVKDKKELDFIFADDIANKKDDKYIATYYRMLDTFKFVK
jgi:hypothetical protein